MPAAARVGDKSQCPSDGHGCPGCAHNVIGPAVAGSPDVQINGMPAVRVGDPGIHAACCGPNTWTATAGSATVFINGKAAHRQNDVDAHCGGVGKMIEGSPDVTIGG
ncbi:MAG: PAAR domain-containing protein [Deltaproteobacteria bacterium]|nr:PAAR domain-containing protein [Deltaproteobacteria bacterium]